MCYGWYDFYGKTFLFNCNGISMWSELLRKSFSFWPDRELKSIADLNVREDKSECKDKLPNYMSHTNQLPHVSD